MEGEVMPEKLFDLFKNGSGLSLTDVVWSLKVMQCLHLGDQFPYYTAVTHT